VPCKLSQVPGEPVPRGGRRHARCARRGLTPSFASVACSARACLPLKLARLLEGALAEGGASESVSAGVALQCAAIADMFPADVAPLIDVVGKKWAHTVGGERAAQLGHACRQAASI
jgi:hypothetical protein